ncbi:rifin PIR protein, putative [Plasmodium reichenowi]|uniref:Rifin PIR protein, putative n=1 Tax=Plasmodium reichenowi TaxID=5854 RepID=A0A2P9DTS7_PLARE|nr:rifin PIR protein, putative [Plasmodium reichenowi]
MKVHYINILLFALALNILASIHKKKPYITPRSTPITRLLCECELYAPVNYDNDPQMKEVMENFNKQTQQRFHEYDDRMNEKRKECKEQCDKEIQKIILKDKLEKEFMDKFSTLQTDIQNDAIPTCICEKTVADKVEKGCLRCAGVLGGGVMPGFGTIGGSLLGVLSAWKPAALKAAMREAMIEGAAQGAIEGKAAGMNVIIVELQKRGIEQYCPQIFEQIQKIESFTELNNFAEPIITKYNEICAMTGAADDGKCGIFGVRLGTRKSLIDSRGPFAKDLVPKLLDGLADKAETTANIHAADVTSKTTAQLTTEKTGEIAAAYIGNQTIIIAAIIAIVVIVLIMVIIYLILRYRRKKKMKKKLQYIKLLEE